MISAINESCCFRSCQCHSNHHPPMHSYAKFNLLSFLYFSFVRVIKLIRNRKYALFCIYEVKLSPDNHNPNQLE